MATSWLLGNKGAHSYFGNIICDRCHQQFSTVVELSSHNCPYCSKCAQLFLSFQECLHHECSDEQKPSVPSSITCGDCNSTFTREEYCAHDCLQEPNDELHNLTCDNCFKVFSSQKNRADHICLYCPGCLVIFSSCERLAQHNCSAEQTDRKEPQELRVQQSDFTCSLCRASFTCQRRLNNHKCAFCSQCSTSFPSYNAFLGHKCNYRCEKCKMTYRSEFKLLRHKCRYCEYCATVFSIYQKFLQHQCKRGLNVGKHIQQEQAKEGSDTDEVTISVKQKTNLMIGSPSITPASSTSFINHEEAGHQVQQQGKEQDGREYMVSSSKVDKLHGTAVHSSSTRPSNMAMITNMPTNDSELQLYRVLEKANLISYYDSFIQQGGDDVQQLCEASEEEFLEIMALVGMSCKPLHVRRLQKALQEWVANPDKFKIPLTSPPQNLAIPFSLGLQQTAQINKMSPHNKWTGPSSIQDTQAVVIPISQMSPSSFKTGASENLGLMDHEENPVPTKESLEGLKEAAEIVMANEQPSSSPPPLNRKLVKDLQHIFDMALDHPDRLAEIRRWSAIYGRFDSKRKSEKPLTLHEVTVNEASAQLCDLDPFLLAQREKLFPLARQVVRESGYRYKHGQSSIIQFKKPMRSFLSLLFTAAWARKESDMASLKSTASREDRTESAKKPKLDNSFSYRDAESSPNPRTVQAEIMKIRREERMNEITSLLTTIKQNQSDTKASIAAAKSTDNLQEVYNLQIELEKLTTQQLLLMTEQTDLIKKQRRSDRYYVAKAREKADLDDGSEGQAGSEADNSENHEELVNSVGLPIDGETNSRTEAPSESTQAENVEVSSASTPVPTSSKTSPRKKGADPTKLLVQHTLMGEGLRLAQAYGNIGDTGQNGETGEEDKPSNHGNQEDIPSIHDNQEKTLAIDGSQVDTPSNHGSQEETQNNHGNQEDTTNNHDNQIKSADNETLNNNNATLEQSTDIMENDLMDVINNADQNGQG